MSSEKQIETPPTDDRKRTAITVAIINVVAAALCAAFGNWLAVLAFVVIGVSGVFYILLARSKTSSQTIPETPNSPQTDNDISTAIAAIVSFLTFVGCWIYCIATYGFLLGVGLGWLPSMIVAAIAGVLWPLILIALVFGAILLIGR